MPLTDAYQPERAILTLGEDPWTASWAQSTSTDEIRPPSNRCE